MRLAEVLRGLDILEGEVDGGIEVTGIVYDSRKVRRGSLFVCIEGFTTDGHRFAAQAAGQGAAALLVQQPVDAAGCPWVRVRDTRHALALASRNFYGDPSSRLHVTGVTGTSGKTAVSFLFRGLMESGGRRTDLVGPVANIVGGEPSFAVRATPESNDLLALMEEMFLDGTEAAVMEISSQGIQLGRIDGCTYAAGIFSNLYSDFVGISDPPAFREALDSKIRFAGRCREIVVNRDAEHAEEFTSMLGRPVLTYGTAAGAGIRASELRVERRGGRCGTRFHLDSPWYTGEAFIGIPCGYFVSNTLAALAGAALEGIDPAAVLGRLETAVVPGCVEPVGTTDRIGVYVDSAHTPRTLDRLLAAMRPYVRGRLTCVFGCNGNTSPSVRTSMGRAASLRADRIIVVPDNPYTEDPERIAQDIAAGFDPGLQLPRIMQDRAGGIAAALDGAADGDVVVITGKGHHNYQMFGSMTEVFSDADHAAALLGIRPNAAEGWT